MCGRFNITDHPGVYDLCQALGVAAPAPNFNVSPGSLAELVLKSPRGNQKQLGYWSLLLEAHPTKAKQIRPNPNYKTFNAQSRRLTESQLWQQPYKAQRCIVPVSGFYEWNQGQCHYITPANGEAFAMAGLYQQTQVGAQQILSFSIITLPPQAEFCHIHDKSYPFALLPQEYATWLDKDEFRPDIYQRWMHGGIRQAIDITKVNAPYLPSAQQDLF